MEMGGEAMAQAVVTQLKFFTGIAKRNKDRAGASEASAAHSKSTEHESGSTNFGCSTSFRMVLNSTKSEAGSTEIELGSAMSGTNFGPTFIEIQLGSIVELGSIKSCV